MIHCAEYVKPDGRRLWLYGRRPPSPLGPVPSPFSTAVSVDTHLRFHPLLREWVIYASHRQERTFLPPASSDPLAPTKDPANPTELPVGDYEVAVFENRFPSLVPEAGPAPAVEGAETAAAVGACEVVVFAQDAGQSLGELPADRISLVLEVWAERTRALARAGMAYVLPFENRGTEMGVTLLHPHGQIYAYAFVPQVQAHAAAALREHYERTGSDLVADLARGERDRRIRVVAAEGEVVAFAPPFGRFPYETWIAPTRSVPDLAGLTAQETADMAVALSQVLRRLDGLWGRPMPYLMTVNQAPSDGVPHPEWTVRIEICPIRRAPEKLKFLAGTELGAGVFANDITPEQAAADLRGVRL
jgi:UDPglucose--hexose-1-phosphate uridylyltransferase